jgi:hypothetical protein
MRITDANWQEEALLDMKRRPPNADGTIGFTMTPADIEWRSWLAYFYGKHMDHRAHFMRERGSRGYMVPCRNPGDFDPDIAEVRAEYQRRVRGGEVPEDVVDGPSSPEKRAAVLARLAKSHPMLARFAGEAMQDAAE